MMFGFCLQTLEVIFQAFPDKVCTSELLRTEYNPKQTCVKVAALGLNVDKAVNIHSAAHVGAFSGSGGKKNLESECFEYRY